MIGIFDSGSGGLTFLTEMVRRFPQYEYVYRADYSHCPYGNRTPDDIRSLTIQGVTKLFDEGCTLVILACNTASAWTLRELQSTIFPDRKILGITIPGAERIIENGWKEAVVFATEQTVQSRTYSERVHLIERHIIVHEIALPGTLVSDIESLLPVRACHTNAEFELLLAHHRGDLWDFTDASWWELVQKYFAPYHELVCQPSIDGFVLWCTHYAYLGPLLSQYFGGKPSINPSYESTLKLGLYLDRHPEICDTISKNGGVRFL